MEDRVERGTRLAALLLVVLAAVSSVWFDALPAWRGRARRNDLGDVASRETALAVARPAVEAHLLRLGEEVARGEARLPSVARLDDFVAAAGRSARAHRVRIVRLQPGDRRSGTEADVLPVKLTVEGDFERLHSWMVALEEHGHLVRFENLRAQALSSGGVQAELQVGLYVARPSAGR